VSQPLATFLATPLDDVSGSFIGHPSTETVLALAFAGLGLISSFWHNLVILLALWLKLKHRIKLTLV